MKVETKYDIGDKVWVVYECNGEVNVYSDIIDSIVVTKEGVRIWFKECCDCDMTEDEIILYEDTEALVDKIMELDNKINNMKG